MGLYQALILLSVALLGQNGWSLVISEDLLGSSGHVALSLVCDPLHLARDG